MKIDNEEVWGDVKSGKYLGLSIEGMFSDRAEEMSKEIEAEHIISELRKLLSNG